MSRIFRPMSFSLHTKRKRKKEEKKIKKENSIQNLDLAIQELDNSNNQKIAKISRLQYCIDI